MNLENFLHTEVRVYRNLVKGVLSVQSKIAGRWLVVGYCQSVSLSRIRVFISKANQARCKREKTRNVHLSIEGNMQNYSDTPIDVSECIDIFTYQPFTHHTLHSQRTGQYITENVRDIVVQNGRVYQLPDLEDDYDPILRCI